MKKYSKLWGTLIGMAVGLGVSKGVLPSIMNDPEIIGDLTMILATAFGTWVAPKNSA